jgi:hypothetical protein
MQPITRRVFLHYCTGTAASLGLTAEDLLGLREALANHLGPAFIWLQGSGCSSLASVTIPNSATNVGGAAFMHCGSLTNITIPDSVTNIESSMFYSCTNLTSVTFGNNVISIREYAFSGCIHLTSITIPNSVTSIGEWAFTGCTGLMGVYFKGNAPSVDPSAFSENNKPTVYYLPGTTGWGTEYCGCPTALWLLPNPLILNNGSSFGVQTNQFGFVISWATNSSVVLEACTELTNPTWTVVGTNNLTGGSSYFNDPGWRNYPTRFYRIRWP